MVLNRCGRVTAAVPRTAEKDRPEDEIVLTFCTADGVVTAVGKRDREGKEERGTEISKNEKSTL